MKGKGAMEREDFVFDFEKLNVYQYALSFANEVFNFSSKFKWEYQSSLGDQFRRAALSICNNLAEGSRKEGRAKIQFYNYALDSSRECIPMINIALSQKQLNFTQMQSLREKCIQITKMLYKLAASVSF